LEVTAEGFRVRTPYSRTVFSKLREVPFSHWDSDLRLWHVPFRSVDHLRRHWPEIEAGAIRNEPAVKKARQAAAKGSEEAAASQARAAERRKKRYPVPEDDLPPLERPVSTGFGIVVLTGTSGEVAEPTDVSRHYPSITSKNLIWASWRRAEFDELAKAWPVKYAPTRTPKRHMGLFAVAGCEPYRWREPRSATASICLCSSAFPPTQFFVCIIFVTAKGTGRQNWAASCPIYGLHSDIADPLRKLAIREGGRACSGTRIVAFFGVSVGSRGKIGEEGCFTVGVAYPMTFTKSASTVDFSAAAQRHGAT